jgi:hypothetical protein
MLHQKNAVIPATHCRGKVSILIILAGNMTTWECRPGGGQSLLVFQGVGRVGAKRRIETLQTSARC